MSKPRKAVGGLPVPPSYSAPAYRPPTRRATSLALPKSTGTHTAKKAQSPGANVRINGMTPDEARAEATKR